MILWIRTVKLCFWYVAHEFVNFKVWSLKANKTEQFTFFDIFTRIFTSDICTPSQRNKHVDMERVYLGLPLDMYISYPTIEPHYHTPLYDRDLRDVAFIYSSRFKIKALCLPSCFWPGKQTVSRRLTSHTCLYTTPGCSYLYVTFKTALRLSTSQKRDSWLYVTYKTHLFASLDMPISKAL